MPRSLSAEFEETLNSIDAGLDSASKLIHQSTKYVKSSARTQVTLPTYDDGLSYTTTKTTATARGGGTGRGEKTTFKDVVEKEPRADAASSPARYREGNRTTTPARSPLQKHPPSVITRHPTPLESDRIRFVHQQKQPKPIATNTMHTDQSKPQLAGRLNGNSMLRLRQACKVADKDGDGQLTKHEFQHVLSNMGVKITEHEAKQLCTKFNQTLDTPSIDYKHFVRDLTTKPLFFYYLSFHHVYVFY